MPEFNLVLKSMESDTKEKTQDALGMYLQQNIGRGLGVRESLAEEATI